MANLLDTSILIRQLRGELRAGKLIASVERQRRILISPITVTEIYVGCLHEAHLRAVQDLFRRFKTVPITASVARKAAHLMQKYPQFFGRGMQRGLADALILSCAWERNVTLYTLNTRHFVAAQITEVDIRAIDPTNSVWR